MRGMLKITSGKFGGRTIAQPNTDKTRPVSEKTRHAIFQTLGDVGGLSVLDLYAGSGALGLEALSLGASSATFVDSAKISANTIRQNVKELDLAARAEINVKKVDQFLSSTTDKYDLIFLDPPYAEFDTDVVRLAGEHLSSNGIIIVSCSSKTELTATIDQLQMIKAKIYGDTQIAYFKLAK